MINDLKNVSIPSMLYGTCVNPIRVTSAQLDKTWKPGVYICYMSIPSITDDYKQDLFAEQMKDIYLSNYYLQEKYPKVKCK